MITTVVSSADVRAIAASLARIESQQEQLSEQLAQIYRLLSRPASQGGADVRERMAARALRAALLKWGWNKPFLARELVSWLDSPLDAGGRHEVRQLVRDLLSLDEEAELNVMPLGLALGRHGVAARIGERDNTGLWQVLPEAGE